jgi:histidine ammonia-lyase
MYLFSELDTSAALLSECKVLVKPASADSIVTSAGQEDYVSMGGFAARKCETLVSNVSKILGIELLMCLTAVDIIGLKTS